MFEKAILNHTYESTNYYHVDVTVEWLRGRQLYPKLRFKLFVEQGMPGLEFRNFADWPKMFAKWPGTQEDQHGPVFRFRVAPDDRFDFGADVAGVLVDLAADLTAVAYDLKKQYQDEIRDPDALIEQARELSRLLLNALEPSAPAAPKRVHDALSPPPPPLEIVAPPPAPELRFRAAFVPTVRATKARQPASPSDQSRKPEPPPDYVQKVMDEFNTVQLTSLRQCGRPLPDRWSPIVISVVKNEFDRLFDFLRHHRAAGIERFVFVDNGSTDGTVEFLASQPDVDLYARIGRFDWMLKQGWINKVVSLYGYERWYIYLDADEQLVFDSIGHHTFSDLTRLMERRGVFRVRGFLIDMYSDGPLLESSYEAHGRLVDSYPYFDLDSYKEEKYKEIISVKGGPRPRVFGVSEPKFRPEMTKYPLFKINPGEFMANPHHIWPYDDNFASERLIGVLHFKFLPAIVDRIRKAIAEENYWDGSFEYKCYLKTLEQDKGISLLYPSSARYEGAADLVAKGMIAPVGWDADPRPAASLRAAYLERRADLLSNQGLSRFLTRDAAP